MALRTGAGRRLSVIEAGTVAYRTALDLQHRMVERRLAGEIDDSLILLEHPPVITMGRSAERSDVLASDAVLAAAGATIETIERGGEVTYHGPGQLVGYAIIDLGAHLRSLKRYVDGMEQLFIDYLATLGVAAERDADHRGVWIGLDKITAIGIAVQRRVTYHGFAFNVTTQLDHFDWIVACGLRDRGQTSLERLVDPVPDIATVRRAVGTHFAETFGYEEIVWSHRIPV